MFLGLKKPLRHCTPGDLVRHSEVQAVRASQAQRKYSLGLLEEAFQLSEKIGPAKAALEAGVNKNSLIHYRLLRLRELGRSRKAGPLKKNNIDPVKKRKCFETYQRLHAAKFGCHRKCWIEAGNRTGINGRSVEMQWVRGIWNP